MGASEGKDIQLGSQPTDRERKATLRSWLILVAMVLLFLIWGFFVFFSVGDKGPPNWDFGVVEDIPGQSPYATEYAEPTPQHVAD
ncbi:MAG: hypothetical protein GTN81_02985 [Proteobacteria bacterium]|nr:hypothetical protein [Pseudomonadota bacterium]